MNTNPKAKKILCYGDSNTWGQSDDKNFASRYAVNVRWPGKLQEYLGDSYEVVEEGLGGRTTNLEHTDQNKPFRNGLAYFLPCLATHSPVDFVVIMLGTNDLKIQYKRSAKEVAETLELYIDTVKLVSREAKVLLVSPILINNKAPKFLEYYQGAYDSTAAERSKQMSGEIQSVVAKHGCIFLDASLVARAGKDGLHLDAQSHLSLAKAVRDILVKNL